MPLTQLLPIAAGVTGVFSLLAVVSVLYFNSINKRQSRSFLGHLAGADNISPKDLIQILKSYGDDDKRTEALKEIIGANQSQIETAKKSLPDGFDFNSMVKRESMTNMLSIGAGTLFAVTLGLVVSISLIDKDVDDDRNPPVQSEPAGLSQLKEARTLLESVTILKPEIMASSRPHDMVKKCVERIAKDLATLQTVTATGNQSHIQKVKNKLAQNDLALKSQVESVRPQWDALLKAKALLGEFKSMEVDESLKPNQMQLAAEWNNLMIPFRPIEMTLEYVGSDVDPTWLSSALNRTQAFRMLESSLNSNTLRHSGGRLKYLTSSGISMAVSATPK